MAANGRRSVFVLPYLYAAYWAAGATVDACTWHIPAIVGRITCGQPDRKQLWLGPRPWRRPRRTLGTRRPRHQTALVGQKLSPQAMHRESVGAWSAPGEGSSEMFG